MRLGDHFQQIKKKYHNTFFSGICFDHRKIKKNYIFFAIKGNNLDGNNFIPSVIKKGCKIIVTEKNFDEWKSGVLFINTKNIRKLLSQISFSIFKKKPNNLIAVTGTNGKSSVSDFYYQILLLNNKKVASIGTLGVRSNNFNLNLFNTTIDPISLGKMLTELKKRKIENVIMEASSHGLHQNRLDGLLFNSAIFTNLSQDHLDYHKNFKNYLNAKLYLFQNLIKKGGFVITDDKIPEFTKIKNISLKKELKLFTFKNKHFQIVSHNYKNEAQILKIKHKNLIHEITVNLVGKIQLKNILMAVIAASKSNLDLKKIFSVIPRLSPVEGRFEKVGKIKNKSLVFLDYAHTPDALQTCILNIREQFSDKHISVLFGCGGDRDKGKRSKMGKIADNYADKIYLTDDNPRHERPKKIRDEIKRGIKKRQIIEISNRKEAIVKAINNLNTGDILIVAGKGHEKIQQIGNRKVFLSDRQIILNSIKKKNFNLSKNLKLNIFNERFDQNVLSSKSAINKASINSKSVKKNDIFFAIKGKKNDGNKFVGQAIQKKASITVVNKIQKKLPRNKQASSINPLGLLTETAKIFRKNISTKIIAITGSCGKTSLKELLGNTLNKISKTTISPKSYNNKYGVPLSLFNINQNDDYGVIEVGMDKKGEIDQLSKIIQPDISVITNINYAHAKNFKNVRQIALAKAEIIDNTKDNGYVVLNADDTFFSLHKKIAHKKKIKVLSFGITNQCADIKLHNIIKSKKKYKICIKLNNIKKNFLISNDFQNYIYNILAALTVKSVFLNILKLDKNIFLNFKTPEGRGDIKKIKVNKKMINLIDESYNSNPLSLKTAILNYDKIKTKNSKKYLILGDMLELGHHSKKLHESIAPVINRTNIDKVFVKGKEISFLYNKISKPKKGTVLKNKLQINDLIENNFDNDDFLMIKASNATGFNKIVKELKGTN